MSIWLYAGNPTPPTFYFKLRIWWSGQSAGNLPSKKGRALQRLHARACSTDSVPSGPKLEGNLGHYLAGLIEGDGAIIVPYRIRSPKGKLYYPSIQAFKIFTFSSNHS